MFKSISSKFVLSIASVILANSSAFSGSANASFKASSAYAKAGKEANKAGTWRDSR